MFFRVSESTQESSSGRFNAGLHFGFDHCTVSVQFGNGNYCDNRYQKKSTCFDRETGGIFCQNAEVRVLDHNGNDVSGWPHSVSHDAVAGWLTTDEVLEVLNWAKDYKPAPQLTVIPPFPQFDFAAAS